MDITTTLLDALPNIIFAWRAEIGLEFVNSAVEAILGYRPEELLADPALATRLVDPEDFERVNQQFFKVLHEPPGHEGHFTIRCRHKAKHLVWLDIKLSKSPLTEEDSAVIFGIAEDVTQRKKNQNSLRLQASLFSKLQTPVLLTNLQGQVIFWNERVAKLFRQSMATMWGMNLYDLLQINLPVQEQLLDDLTADTFTIREFALESEDKEPFWIELSGCLLHDEDEYPTGFLFVPMDITKQKTSDILREISAVLVSSLELNTTLSIILRSLEKLLKFDSAAIYLLTASNRLKMVNGRGMPYIELTLASATETEVFPLDETVLSNKKPVAIVDVRQDIRWTPLKGTNYIRSWLGVPLLFRDKPLGMVTIDRAMIDPFTSDQIALAEAFAGHAAIALQNAELFSRIQSQQEHLRKLTHRVVTAQEDERRRISRELHDELGQSLTLLKLNLEMMLATSLNSEQLIERLTELIELSNSTLQEVRRLAMDLRPAMLDDLGLVPTLRWYREQYQKRSACNVTLSVISHLPRLAPETETALYRITQEALTNVSRHAQAKNVEINLDMDDNFIKFSIIDDGQGFSVNTEDRVDSFGVGLVGMLERIDDLNGKFNILSTAGQGTTISILIPYHIALTPEK